MLSDHIFNQTISLVLNIWHDFLSLIKRALVDAHKSKAGAFCVRARKGPHAFGVLRAVIDDAIVQIPQLQVRGESRFVIGMVKKVTTNLPATK